MAAIDEKIFPLNNAFSFVVQTKAGAQHDYFIPTAKDGLNMKGVLIESARALSGATASVLRGTLTVNNKSTAYTAGTMSIAYDGATLNRSADPFYLQTTYGEILEVKDATPTAASGTLTVLRRACLGTTASATGVADDDVLYVMNIIQLEDATATPTQITVVPLPEDPGVPLFK